MNILYKLILISIFTLFLAGQAMAETLQTKEKLQKMRKSINITNHKTNKKTKKDKEVMRSISSTIKKNKVFHFDNEAIEFE